ncbi:MAG: hypothetical protein EBR34_08255 [Sphingomonadaceae bacterium]|nr:hypothetical protein [Sphingomonadaceae bacterium]
MSRHLHFALSASALFALAGCGGADQPEAPEQAPNAEAVTPAAQPSASASEDHASHTPLEPAAKAQDTSLRQSEAKPEPKASPAKPRPKPAPAPAPKPASTTPTKAAAPPTEPDPHAGHDMKDM